MLGSMLGEVASVKNIVGCWGTLKKTIYCPSNEEMMEVFKELHSK